jgi:hypothetical protein
MEIELDPPQPPAVARLVRELLGGGGGVQVDPWWQAGVDEAVGAAVETEPAPAVPVPRARRSR